MHIPGATKWLLCSCLSGLQCPSSRSSSMCFPSARTGRLHSLTLPPASHPTLPPCCPAPLPLLHFTCPVSLCAVRMKGMCMSTCLDTYMITKSLVPCQSIHLSRDTQLPLQCMQSAYAFMDVHIHETIVVAKFMQCSAGGLAWGSFSTGASAHHCCSRAIASAMLGASGITLPHSTTCGARTTCAW